MFSSMFPQHTQDIITYLDIVQVNFEHWTSLWLLGTFNLAAKLDGMLWQHAYGLASLLENCILIALLNIKFAL